MFGANSRFSNEHDFELEFSRHGACRNGYVNPYGIEYYFECPDFDWQRVLELQLLGLTTPNFQLDKLKIEKKVVKNELKDYLDNYYRRMWQRKVIAMGDSLLPDRQRLASLPQINLQHLTAHYRATHTLANLRFIIAGNLKPKLPQLLPLLENINLPLGKLLPYTRPQLHCAPPFCLSRPDANNLSFHLFLALPHSLTPREENAINVLTQVLTGSTYSLIYGRAREKGLTYAVDSYYSFLPRFSTWEIDGSCALEYLDELFAIITQVLQLVAKGKTPPADLQATKSYLLGNHQMCHQTVESIVNYYSTRFYYLGAVEDFARDARLIETTTVADLAAIAQQFLSSRLWCFSAIGRRQTALVKKLNRTLTPLFL
jgi:predicted Zn-dependent peptidase